MMKYTGFNLLVYLSNMCHFYITGYGDQFLILKFLFKIIKEEYKVHGCQLMIL